MKSTRQVAAGNYEGPGIITNDASEIFIGANALGNLNNPADDTTNLLYANIGSTKLTDLV